MINSNETIDPNQYKVRKINTDETIDPGSKHKEEQTDLLLIGESIADSYIINALFNKQGKQSTIYLAKKWGKSYIIKIYQNSWKPSNQIQSFLINVRHPNIANVIENGIYKEHYYEIYEYFPEGTLEEASSLSVSHIQDIIVPSINEGLHELHRNGIVHCDIKPSNLFYANEYSKIVIGDYGVSGYTNSTGKFIDTLRGTPEYAPRVKALMWNAVMSPAYDYGSFGLVLCKTILGTSIFQGMNVEEIARAWERGLKLPNQINGRLRTLIEGLLNEDEEQRWGYEQVKRWCDGEFVRQDRRNIYMRVKKDKKIKPLIFGRFDGKTISVLTLHQLTEAIKNHWDQGTRLIKRKELIDFIQQFEEMRSVIDEIRKLSYLQDSDAAVFKLLIYLGDNKKNLFYCGQDYQTLYNFTQQLSKGNDETAKRFLSSGLLIFYLRQNGYNEQQITELEKLVKRTGSQDLSSVLTICRALQGETSVNVFGHQIDDLETLVPILAQRTIKEIDELLNNAHFISWMNRLGYDKEMKEMKEMMDHE